MPTPAETSLRTGFEDASVSGTCWQIFLIDIMVTEKKRIQTVSVSEN